MSGRYFRVADASYVGVKSRIYMYSFRGSMMAVFDLEKETMEIKVVPYSSARQTYMFGGAVEENGVIYFLPCCADKVMTYNIGTDEFGWIEAEIPLNGYYSAVKYEHKIFMLPRVYSDQMPYLQIGKNEVRIQKIDFGKQWEIAPTPDFPINYVGNQVVEDKVYRVHAQYDVIQEFSLTTKSAVYYKLPLENVALVDICFDGRLFWIASYSDGIIRAWDRKRNIIVNEINISEKINTTNICFTKMELVGEWLYLATGKRSSLIVIYNIKTGEVRYYDCDEIPGFRLLGITEDVYMSESILATDNGSIVFLPLNANGIVMLTPKQEVRFIRTDIDAEKLWENGKKADGILTENTISLSQYIEQIDGRKDNAVSDGCKKTYIWDEIVKGLQK